MRNCGGEGMGLGGMSERGKVRGKSMETEKVGVRERKCQGEVRCWGWNGFGRVGM